MKSKETAGYRIAKSLMEWIEVESALICWQMQAEELYEASKFYNCYVPDLGILISTPCRRRKTTAQSNGLRVFPLGNPKKNGKEAEV